MTQHATAMTEQIVEYSPYGLELDREGVAGSMARNHNIRYGWFEDRDNSVHQYRGQERHRSTGLDYMMARHYSAAMGSFTQPDPAFDLGDAANPAGFGLYGYALGNPIAYWDPTGMVSDAWHGASTAAMFPTAAGLLSGAGSAGVALFTPDEIDVVLASSLPFMDGPLPVGEVAAAGIFVGRRFVSINLLRKAGRAFDRGFDHGTAVSRKAAGGDVPKGGAAVAPRVSQKQLRHIRGRPEHRHGGFLDSVEDAQRVLDAYRGGATQVVGKSRQGFPVVRFDGVTGTNVNRRLGISGEPTNIFMIKGTASPSVVPMAPGWVP